MNRFPIAFNAVQGVISLTMTYVYFTRGERLIMMILIFTLLIISLVSISLGLVRRRRLIEIVEVLVYVTFFGFCFLGVQDLRSILASDPVPNYFWVVCAIGISLNWGEWLGKTLLKITSRPDSDIEE